MTVIRTICDAELAEHVGDEVVRQRPRRGRALELHQDRRRLRVADPDREELVPVGGLEQDDRLLADEIEADPVDDHLVHQVTPAPVIASGYRLKLPQRLALGRRLELDLVHRRSARLAGRGVLEEGLPFRHAHGVEAAQVVLPTFMEDEVADLHSRSGTDVHRRCSVGPHPWCEGEPRAINGRSWIRTTDLRLIRAAL